MTFLQYMQANWHTVLDALLSHIQMSFISIVLAILIAVPLGILITKHEKAAKVALSVAGVVQTIPGLVMLGIGLLIFGLGLMPAVIVLTAYAILPILQNTYTGIHNVADFYIEAGRGIGMTGRQILFKIKLPMAVPAIFSGIRMSVVYTISWATLAALIGAGGLGDLIWTGLSCYDTNAILAGAIPASLLAILAGALIRLIQKAVTPRGMKIKKKEAG